MIDLLYPNLGVNANFIVNTFKPKKIVNAHKFNL